MKKILLLALLMWNLTPILAQQVYGTIGAQKIDSSFLQAMHLLYPSFTLTPNAALFKKGLNNLYVQTKASADEARKLGIDKDTAIQKQLALVKQLAEDKWLELIMKTKMATPPTVTDAEAKDYYNQHLAEFTNPGKYSFLMAVLYDTSATNIKAAKQALETYAKSGNPPVGLKVGNTSTYLLTFEKNREIFPNQGNMGVVKTLKPLQISQPVTNGSNKIMFCVITKQDDQQLPFEQVKTLCRNQVLNEKTNAQATEATKQAMDKYPIELDTTFFHQ